jgi:phosphoglycolate phosphatase-like HAD superfamily hydrolase
LELLALDFDGVLSDSAPEAWLVTLHTYAALRPAAAVTAMRERAEGRDAAEIRRDPDYGRFLAMMALGNGAADFAVALRLICGGDEAADQAAFDTAYALEEPSFRDEFRERFYETRALLRQRDPARWNSLLGPYPDFVEIVRRRAADVRLAIATAKDRTSVRLLLDDYGIADLFPDEMLVDKEAGRSKRSHLAILERRLSIPYEQIVFVDDKVNHLDDVASLGVGRVLAAWGYNGEREHQLARESGHLVCGLDDFESQLFGAAPAAPHEAPIPSDH